MAYEYFTKIKENDSRDNDFLSTLERLDYSDGFKSVKESIARKHLLFKHDFIQMIKDKQREGYSVHPITISFNDCYYPNEFKDLSSDFSSIIFESISKKLQKNIFDEENRHQLPLLYLFVNQRQKSEDLSDSPITYPEFPHLQGFLLIYPNSEHKENLKDLFFNEFTMGLSRKICEDIGHAYNFQSYMYYPLKNLNLHMNKFIDGILIQKEVNDVFRSVNYATSFMLDSTYSDFLEDREFPYIMGCNDKVFDSEKGMPSYFSKEIRQKISEERRKLKIYDMINFRLDFKRRSKIVKCSQQFGISVAEFFRLMIDDFDLKTYLR